ncbi:carbohydrate ABC transporter permease (plasmid) [Rhizobium ruizarguesonis]|jgi:raffinose/stachyose/melibiose transport system permease protein|uniref:ABC transporter permease subunit n=1 Tax=Rhizobium ruizarguesonis TaxID=2081791 RepID=A0AAE4YNB8_9HYPH|nr:MULTISPECIES: carbohydrate ABC transporter permease [Rhizobium]NEJ21451.1 ABC transporter permease subunit [Rhizobium leguminosarum]MCB2401169.1 carbohydrate ABC transporter permease [Rhizobium ruizarguesonis]NEH28755.1 ABC transporter permease subunit [Rhizobium ruizarguesonis]NEH37623.1 ABC transporter permease subunit [Rhizobium ruizarguesonis]NEH62567.1 ABC transporter permease subunit [Rhizobium ruizarguesonis]
MTYARLIPQLARLAILLIVVTFVLGPLTVAVFGGFKTNGELLASPFGIPSHWNTEFYSALLNDPSFWKYLGNSLIISISTVVLTLIVAAAAAYVFAQIRFFGSKMMMSYLLAGLVFPFATAILPLFIKVRDFGLLDSYWAVILPQTAFGLSLSILLFKTFFEQLPKELFEAAYVEGCGYIRFFWRFTLPLSTPILATVGVFAFVQSWNNFLLPLVVINSRDLFTWPLGMMQFRGEFLVEWNRVLAFITLTILPAVVFFVAAQKYIVAGLTGGAVKG